MENYPCNLEPSIPVCMSSNEQSPSEHDADVFHLYCCPELNLCPLI